MNVYKKIKYCTIIFLLISEISIGQNKKINIAGNVAGSRNKKPIANALIKLVCSDSSSTQTYTDTLGNYSITKNINRELKAYLSVFPPEQRLYGSCPITYKNQILYLPEKFKFSISPDSSNYNLVRNIFLSAGDIDYNIPTVVYFTTNSLDFSLSEKCDFLGDTAIDCMVDFLKTNPKMFLKIAGYSEKKENGKQLLSEQRAKKIYDLFIKKGIDIKRLSFAGYSDSISNSFASLDNKLKTNNGKVELHISIIDFNSK